jgi:hypothetical protein
MSRAKYIVGTVKQLQTKPDGGEKWLASLREKELPDVIEALCTSARCWSQGCSLRCSLLP